MIKTLLFNLFSSSKNSFSFNVKLMCLGMFFVVNLGFGQRVWTGTKDTNWNDAANWDAGGVPSGTQNVSIPSVANSPVVTGNASCTSVTFIGNTGSLTVNAGVTLTVGGAITVNSSNSSSRDIFILGAGTLSSSSVTVGLASTTPGSFRTTSLTSNIANFNISSDFILNSTRASATIVNNAIFNLESGIMNLNGQVKTVNQTSTNSTFSMASGSQSASLLLGNSTPFALSGTALNTVNLNGNSSTVNYDGGAQNVYGTAYNNLTSSGSGNKTVSGNSIVVNKDFTLSGGTFVLNNGNTNYTLTILGNYNQTTGGVFEFNLGNSGTSIILLGGNFNNSSTAGNSIKTTGTVSNGVVNFIGAGTQTLNNPTTGASFYVSYLVNTGSVLKLLSPLTLTSSSQTVYIGTLTVNGTVDFGTFTVSQSGGTSGVSPRVAVNSGATLITANTGGIDGSVSTTNMTRTFDTGANYIFNGTAAQITSSGLPNTVNNLSIDNSAGVTLSKSTTITNDFSLTSGSTANLGSFTSPNNHKAKTITLDGAVQSSGTWGGTGSAALNKSALYFGGTATGVVNISSTTCTTGYWTGVASTDWKEPANWCGGVPTASTDVIIPAGTPFQPTIGASTNALAKNLTINASASVTLSTTTSSLNISGNFINNGNVSGVLGSSILFSGTVAQSIGGFTTLGNISMTKTGGVATFTGAINAAALTINGAGGTLNLGASLAHTFTGDINLSAGFLNGGSSTLNANSSTATSWNGTGTNFTAATGTVNFGGGAQTIATATTFNNLILSGSGAKTLGVAVIAPNLTITGVTANNGSTLTVSTALSGTGTLVNAASGTLNIGGTNTINTLNAAAAGNTVNYNGATQTVAGIVYSNLTLSNAGTKTFNAATTVTGNLSNSVNATLATGNFGVTLGGNFTNSGTFNAGSSSIIINGTATQSIAGFSTTGQISITKSGLTTFTSSVSTTGNLSLSSGAVVDLGSILTHMAGTLTLNGNSQNGGKWGGSLATTATNKSATYFGTTASGIVTVASPSCTLGYWTGITSTDWNIGSNWCGGNVPTSTVDVVIPAGTPFSPSISGTASVNDLTINSSATLTIVDNASSKLNINGNFINNGNFIANGTSSMITFGGNNQNVASATYSNLTLSGTSSSTKNFSTSIVTITGNLTINSGIVTNLSTAAVTHTAATLTLGGMSTPAGTWGNTVSNPSNINDTYFAATVGKVNVGASCILPIVYAMTGANNKTYCSIEAGSTIGLPNSETGVSYQLMKGNVAVGVAKDGTNGSSLTFGVYNSTGTYTIVATRVSTLCKSTMSGPINIYRTSSPPLPTAIVTNASCPGTTTGSINVTNTVAPSSLSFVSASSQYVDLRTTLLSDRTAFTVEGWIKFDATKVLPRMSIFGQNDVIEIAFEDGGVKGWTQYGSVLVPLTEITGGYVWHHIAVTGDATSLKIYLDGGAPKTTNISISNFGSSTDSTKMGYGVMDSGGTGLTGEVFKLGFWNRALTAGEVTTLSSGFVEYDASLSGLLAGYSFNESSGSTIAGVGSAAPIGYLENGPTWTDPYTYSWTSSPAGFTSSSKNITGLTDRTYNLKTSLKGCTNEGTWTVNATNLATTVTGQPSSTAICVGSNTSFGVTANGTNLSYKWQVSTNGGVSFSDLTNVAPYSGVATATLNITAATVAMSTYQYLCVVTGTCLPALNSNAATLTVNPTTVGGTIASSAPNNSLCTASNSATLTLSGQTGSVLRWESSTDNLFTIATPISNTTTSLPISNITTTTYYRAVVQSGACNTVNSSVIKIISGRPTANAATALNCAGFTANWNKVDGATSYRISISTDNFVTVLSAYDRKDVGGDVNSFAVTGLAPNTAYQYIIYSVLPCGTYATASNIISVTTSDLPIAGSFTGGAAAICIGEKTTFANGTPGGTWSISNGTGTATITNLGVVTGGTQGAVNVVYTVNNGTCSNSISRSLTINPPFSAPTVGTITPVSCSAAGSIALSGLPSGSWTITQSGFASDTKGGTGSSTTISGLAKGNYSFTITSGNCTSGSTASIEIKDESSTSWNGTSWSNGNPSKDKSAIITSVSPNQPFVGDPNPNVYRDFYACSLTINNGSGEVIVPSNVTLTVYNAVITNGNLRFKNNSSLVQVNDDPLINSGNITYERSTTPLFRKDYVYWSTPVSPQTLGALSPSSSLMYSNDGTKWVAEAKTNNMIVGNGYIIRAPDNYYVAGTRQVFDGVFIGKPNNGALEGLPLAEKKSYVIGNPYPSALDADKLLDTNKMLDGTIYFWTHNTPAKVVVSNQYSSDDYASYNSSGGVSAKSDPDHNDDPTSTLDKKPTGKIAAGQAFYVRVLVAGKVKFNNSMRVGGAQNTQFFKPGASGAIEKNRVWLNMTSAGGAFKQLLVAYIEGATNDYENRYDGLTFSANPTLDFYSVNNASKFVIQGRALPFVDTDIVPLGYKTTVVGDLTISIDEVDGKMTNQAIYIEDKTTGEIHDLRASDYTFKSEIGTFLDRLVLRYTARTLGTGDFENLENGILVSVKNKVINVLSSKENIKEVTVFDVSGKLLYNKKKVGNTELQISNLPFGDQVLLVKVTLENDFTTTKKIVF